MDVDVNVGYFGLAAVSDPAWLHELEVLGVRTLWAAEAYGADAVTVLAAAAAHTSRLGIGSAILQMPARSPAMTAMTAATLDDLSGGRFRLGLGLSGPQVVEGWHGVPYGSPLTRTREYVEIVRLILARQGPVVYEGSEYRLPYDGPGATGLGKPLKLIGSPHPGIPIYLAAIGPRNVALAAEVADGWLPVFYSPERAHEVFGPALSEGFSRSPEPDRALRFDVVPTVPCALADDMEAARLQVKPQLALYLGGMGARGRNFYNDLARRYGFDEAAERVQDLYLEGRKAEAIAAVPDALVDEVSLVGPAGAIRDRMAAWNECGVGAIAVGSMDLSALRVVVEAAA
jgi:F420-dependent oxidoreductase-like protein